MNKSEQQMWDAIKAHYEKYPEKWSVVRDGNTYAFLSTGVKVLLAPSLSYNMCVYCMGISGGYDQMMYWQDVANKWEDKLREDKALSVIKALEENS